MGTGRPITDAAVRAGEDLPLFIERHLDCAYLVETLSRLAQVPTDVPLGWQTLMEPDDPKLVYYVQKVLRPELVRLGMYDLLDCRETTLSPGWGQENQGGHCFSRTIPRPNTTISWRTLSPARWAVLSPMDAMNPLSSAKVSARTRRIKQ